MCISTGFNLVEYWDSLTRATRIIHSVPVESANTSTGSIATKLKNKNDSTVGGTEDRSIGRVTAKNGKIHSVLDLNHSCCGSKQSPRFCRGKR